MNVKYCLLTIVLLAASMTTTQADCPQVCACKWKGGKETVECANRNLTRLPQGAREATQVLDLSENHLVRLREDVFKNLGLVNLQKLYLSKSNITLISSRAFTGLVGLVELDLSGNYIGEVPSDTFPSCTGLMRLILNNNPMRSLLRDAFKPLTQLTTLEMSNCQLTSIEQGAFNGLQALEWLKLDGNRLTYVPEMTLPLPSNLHGLTLHNNPWLCNCRLRPLQDWLNRSALTAPQESDPVCESPPRLQQKVIKAVRSDDLACLPEIQTEAPVEIDEGTNVTLYCNVHAIPAATVTWSYNGEKCENHDENDAIAAYIRPICKQRGHTNLTNILYIYGAEKSDEGLYTCIAENTAGLAEANLSLRVRFLERSTAEPPFENSNTSYIAAIAGGALVGTLLVLGCVIGGIIYCARKRRDQKRNSKALSCQSKVANPIAKENETLPRKSTDAALDSQQQVMYAERELARTASLDRRETIEAYRGPVAKYLTEPDLINEVYPSTNAPNPNENYNIYQHQITQPRHVLDYADTRYSLQPAIDPRPSLSQIPYLDQDGYPLNFGLPKISINPISCTLPRLRHRMPEGSAAAPTARYTREAEFLARSTPHDTTVLSRPDARYTAEGYPYPIGYQPITSPVRQPLQIPPYVSPEIVMPEVSEVPFIPSPPAAYKGEPTPLSPRSLMSKTAHEAAAAVAARVDDARPPDHPESPDEGYVGDAMDV